MVDSVKIRVLCFNLKKGGLDSLELKRAGHLQFARLSHTFSWGGSYQYQITFMIYRENTLEMEFSVPKLLYGHNLHDDHVGTVELLQALRLIKQKLDTDYCTTQDIEQWEVLRLDICKNFTVQNIDDILLKLQSVTYPKKKCFSYPESVMWVGSTFSLKFYDKQKEFKKHDFKRVETFADYRLALQLLASTGDTLRFETTLRKRALETLFRSVVVTVDNLINFPVEKNQKILSLLKWAQKHTEFKKVQDLVTHQVFTAKLGKTRGTRLFNFWQQWQTKTGRAILKKSFTRDGLYKKMKQAEAIIEEYVAEIASFSKGDETFEFEKLPENATNVKTHPPL